MNDKVKVLLVEDDDDFVFLIQKLIQKDARLEYLGHASDRVFGVEMAQNLKPDIVVMDLNLSGSELDGIMAAKEIRLTTDAKILLLTSFEQPDIIIDASKKAFASGYVFKSDCQSLADIVYTTTTSHTPQEQFIKELLISELTPAEKSLISYLIEGKDDTLITSSQKTIANQKTSIFKKLGLKNTAELIRVFK